MEKMTASPEAEAEAKVIWHIFHEVGLVEHRHEDWEVEEARNFMTVAQEHSLERRPASEVLDMLAFWLRFHEGVGDRFEAKGLARLYLDRTFRAFEAAGAWQR